ncbi:ATP-grasp domain-containing protein [Tolypothrix sp. FACHB-123]|uniref:ATP-grasp domain-containing protein n=1 Tax=Tolypothrix sp. FACHB-123 TaxID=2692868 RepID=UPI0016824546|nr:ATP-grasp domain-containing protein [Tolypothrix sp. FACHB-123]MBD2358451.1 ATP-grasp domain-containing protein [Tolypothrix sp. FACHB-123]
MSSEAVISSLRKNHFHKIIGFDIYPQDWIATSKLVDLFHRVPLSKDKEYIETILKICLQNQVEFLIPLTDPEVDILSVHVERFKENGINLCISNQDSVAIARDKLKVFNFFKESNEILTIPTFEKLDEINTNIFKDVIAKPRRGRSSEGVIKFSKIDNLKNYLFDRDDYIFQPIIEGTFITVDTIRNDNGNHVSISRKELLRTKNGAGIVVELFRDKQLEKIVNNITDYLGISGCINIEFILYNGKYLLMDINPRFSAGIGFSIIAGYDFVGNHLKCFQSISIDEEVNYESRILSKRYVDIINN